MRTILSGGDRRSVGRVVEVVELVLAEPERVRELAGLLWDMDAVVRMRAADALEKVSRELAACMVPFKADLLGLMAETRQQELRWHLALMVARMGLDARERRRAAAILESYLEDRSSIVKTCVMQGLWELALQDARLRERVIELVRELTRTGTAAMRARGRKLLAEPVKQIPR